MPRGWGYACITPIAESFCYAAKDRALFQFSRELVLSATRVNISADKRSPPRLMNLVSPVKPVI